jgi:hypothetical protein
MLFNSPGASYYVEVRLGGTLKFGSTMSPSQRKAFESSENVDYVCRFS